jgi:hypothetical protein
MFGFKPQKGILSGSLLIIGAATVMFSWFIFFFLYLEPRSISVGSLEFPDDFRLRILFYTFAIFLFFVGLYLTNIYPRILLTRGGLHYLGFMFYYGQIRWNEIDSLFELKNGTILILINPKRFFMFKGMLFQRLTGVLLGHKRPVLLLAPGFELRDRIIQEIMANSLVKEVHKFGESKSAP